MSVKGHLIPCLLKVINMEKNLLVTPRWANLFGSNLATENSRVSDLQMTFKQTPTRDVPKISKLLVVQKQSINIAAQMCITLL